ncbi:hypothetical protein [Bradyrhizobium cytisi]|uniref:Uncharacterized protein n=1 Tax=Bradyrhizobium cytisi TaxID=515489 RepID=A0A5S4VX64_9BRAD|nr:hypothetical protein [Bradyrhizobium cytisi]TYL70337.1 hypothetical protein FXB38_41795 [Bradyrhizobium cytisi]
MQHVTGIAPLMAAIFKPFARKRDLDDDDHGFRLASKWDRSNERVLALGNPNLMSDSMQDYERMMLRTAKTGETRRKEGRPGLGWQSRLLKRRNSA